MCDAGHTTPGPARAEGGCDTFGVCGVRSGDDFLVDHINHLFRRDRDLHPHPELQLDAASAALSAPSNHEPAALTERTTIELRFPFFSLAGIFLTNERLYTARAGVARGRSLGP